jgi:hypothetical protein
MDGQTQGGPTNWIEYLKRNIQQFFQSYSFPFLVNQVNFMDPGLTVVIEQ